MLWKLLERHPRATRPARARCAESHVSFARGLGLIVTGHRRVIDVVGGCHTSDGSPPACNGVHQIRRWCGFHCRVLMNAVS